MSIVCYTGLPGDGKSYSAVENFVIPALKEGRHLATNLELNLAALSVVCERQVDHLVHMFPKECTPDEVIAHCPPGAVVVIDEVWKYWPAGVAVNEVPKHQVAFFKEHRHRVGDDGLATEICIIDQDPATGVPKFLRSLIELTYLHTKLSTIGAKGNFRVEVYSRCQSAEKPSKGALVRRLQGRYKPEVWNCYISHTQSKRMGEAGLEKAVDGRANVLKGWTFKSAVISALLLPFIIWYAVASIIGFTSNGAKKTPPTKEPFSITPEMQDSTALPPGKPAQRLPPDSGPSAARTPQAPEQAPAPPPEPQAPAVSELWRIVGVVAKGDGTGVALLASATGRRRLDLQTHCTYDKAAVDWRCELDGQIVTYWSGNKMGGNLNAGLVPGSATDANMPKS